MGTQSPRAVSLASTAALLAAMAGAFALPLLLTSESATETAGTWTRGRYFWPKLVTFEAVMAVTWVAMQPFSSRMWARPRMTGGAIVAGHVVWSIGSGTLLALIILSSLAADDVLHWFVAAAIVTIVAMVAIQSALVHAAFAQVSGMERIASTTPGPDELVALLKNLEKGLQEADPETTAGIKRVREHIAYSLPKVGRIAASSRYAQLVAEVHLLHERARNGEPAAVVRASCAEIAGLLELLRTELKEN